MNILEKMWYRVSYSGVHADLTDEMRKKVIITNRMGFIAFLVIFKSVVLLYRAPTILTISFITGLLYLSCAFWSSMRLYNVGRVIMTVVPPAFILYNGGLMTDGPAVSSKFILLGVLVCPILLFQLTEPVKMWMGIIWIMLVLVFFDPITDWIPRHPEVINDTALDNPFVSTMNALVSMIIIIVAFINFTLVNKKSEEDLKKQVNRLQAKYQAQVQSYDETQTALEQTRQEYAALEQMNRSLSSQALRAQMDPHFMFNALNSIQNFILSRDTVSAINYVSKFSKLMRQTMESSLEETITIEEEIALLKNYLDLEKLRFNNVFEYVFELDDEIDASYTEIPSMLLQPFIENAVLHGLRHKKSDGVLKVIFLYQFEHILCIIEDNGMGRERSAIINAGREGHKSHGSSVTANRLALLNAKSNTRTSVVYIDLYDESKAPRGTRVEITIPLEY